MLTASLAPDQALLMTHCNSVHTCFMRYPIDVVYLDSQGKITKLAANLQPWHFSTGDKNAAHTLELAAGSIQAYQLKIGDCLANHLNLPAKTQSRLNKNNKHQSGATMLEFAIVGPIITAIGLGALQYSMLFFAKNQINYASFMAARAGSMGNANIDTIQTAYLKALIPLYGGGRNDDELKEAYDKVLADTFPINPNNPNNQASNVQIQILNPTKESFDDWNDPVLQKKYGARAIPNSGLAFKNAADIPSNSGQNIQDANLIKLRITHGYQPKVPLMAMIYSKFLKEFDPRTDAFQTQLINAGRIPVVTHVTLQMQSDAIEGSTVSSPSTTNNGTSNNPGNPSDPSTTTPPNCLTIGCSVENTPVTPSPTQSTPNPGNNNDNPILCSGDSSNSINSSSSSTGTNSSSTQLPFSPIPK